MAPKDQLYDGKGDYTGSSRAKAAQRTANGVSGAPDHADTGSSSEPSAAKMPSNPAGGKVPKEPQQGQDTLGTSGAVSRGPVEKGNM